MPQKNSRFIAALLTVLVWGGCLLLAPPAIAQSRLPPETFAPWRSWWQPYFAVRAQRRWLMLDHQGTLPTQDDTGDGVDVPIRYRYDASHRYYDGNGLSMAVGIELNAYRLRTELQFGYQYASGVACFQSDRDGTGAGTAYTKFSCKKSHSHLYEYLLNVYHDIDLSPFLPKTQQHWAQFHPHIGFGLGYSVYNGSLGADRGASLKSLNALAHPTDDSRLRDPLVLAQSGFIYALHLGVSYKWYELGYRFLSSNKPEEVFGGHSIGIGFRF